MSQEVTNHTLTRELGAVTAALEAVPTNGYLAYSSTDHRQVLGKQFGRTAAGTFIAAGSYWAPLEFSVAELARAIVECGETMVVAETCDARDSRWARVYALDTTTPHVPL